MEIIVALTGTTGAMGSEALRFLAELEGVRVRALISKNRKKPTGYVAKIAKKNKGKVEFLQGDIRSRETCEKLLSGADYLVHCGGVIPPKIDHNPETGIAVNFLGTKNLVDSILEQGNRTKMIHVSTVANYGQRSYPIHWARVGDPMISSDFDNYSLSKMQAERYVLESGLAHFVSLRQTAILHKYMFANNLKDGLMFQTPWNNCLEWTTDIESGILIRNLIREDVAGNLVGFWNRCFNIGGGESGRKTGYETLNDGFRLMGRSAKCFFDPDWNVTRNFHGCWFLDSDELEEFLHFRTETYAQYWKRMGRKYWYFRIGAILPPSWIRRLIFQPLLENTNAPMYWVNHKKDGRVKAFFGGYEAHAAIGKDWKKFPLLCEKPDYEREKTLKYAKEEGKKLDHGFDDGKKDEEITLDDLRSAALFRGGELISDSFKTGELHKKLLWKCACGEVFSSTPYTVLRGGYWCPKCCEPLPWAMGKAAKNSPYFAQVYYTTHDKGEEEDVYPMDGDDESFLRT